MSAKVDVILPLPLRAFTGGKERVQVEGVADLGELVQALGHFYPGIKSRLTDAETGALLPYIHYFINGNSRRPTEKTPLEDGDEVAIIPAIAGG